MRNLIWFVVLLIPSCGVQPHGAVTVVRDSAGLVIVEHGPELPANVDRWVLESTPMLEIGSREGADPYLFTRIAYAGVLPGEEIVVADRPVRELRIFDSDGGFVRRIGRDGSGPGEFRDITWVGVERRGHITVYDHALRRLTRVTNTGALLETAGLPAPPEGVSFGTITGQFFNGSILMRSTIGLGNLSDPASVPTGLVRDSIGLFLIEPHTTRRREIGRFPGSQTIRVVAPGMVGSDAAPFGLGTVVAVGDSHLYVSTQEAWEIRSYRPDGSPSGVIRRLVRPQPVDTDARMRWRQRWDDQIARFKGPPPPHLVEIAKYHSFPDVYPAHGNMLVDRGGNIWVENYRPFPIGDSVGTWVVLSPDGAIVATAELPAGQITEVLDDRVVGVWRGEDDVPVVRVYQLLKGNHAPSAVR